MLVMKSGRVRMFLLIAGDTYRVNFSTSLLISKVLLCVKKRCQHFVLSSVIDSPSSIRILS